MTLEDLLTLEEAATSLGISTTAMRAQANRGRLQARKLGKTWVTLPQFVEVYRRDHLGNSHKGPKRSVVGLACPHADERHYALGMCRRCYQSDRERKRVAAGYYIACRARRKASAA